MVEIARVVSALKSCTHSAFLAILAIFNGSNKHTVQVAARYSPPASQQQQTVAPLRGSTPGKQTIIKTRCCGGVGVRRPTMR